MKVVVWGINYAPEVTGIAPCNTALCEFLHAQGHRVEMVTTFSYYPQWEKSPADRYALFRTDIVREVAVHRCWHYVPRRVGVWKRVLCEGSFVITSFLRALVLRKADIYVVVSPPLLLGAAAWLLTAIKGGVYHFHVQDLQPDAAVGLNMLRAGTFTRALYALEAFAYKKAAKISGIGPGMIDAFRGKGVPEQKIALLPNGYNLDGAKKSFPIDFRAKYGMATDCFLAVYAGNLGAKQGLDIILDASKFLVDPRIRLLICGDGAWRHILAERIRRENISNVELLPLLDEEEYRAMLNTADVCLITQKAGSGNAFLPSKLLPTLAYRSAVVSVADEDSALAQAMAEGHFGKNILPDHPELLAEILVHYAADNAELEASRENGYAYVCRFDHARVMADFEKVLIEECAVARSSKVKPRPTVSVVPSPPTSALGK